MFPITTLKAASILNYTGPLIDAPITNIVTDSRQVTPKTLFLAINGEKFDGHDFIPEALNKGAPAVVAERLPEGADPARVILVKDTLKAFGALAHYNRLQYKGTLIGLTGSSGKTTTKEELKLMLSAFAPTYATTGNYNNFIGVPRSLLDLAPESSYAVIEMGMSALGEIQYLTSLAAPDIAVVTNVYPMHLEFLGSLANIATAKAEIFSGLKPGAPAIYNEDTAFAEILQDAAKKAGATLYGFGKNTHAPVPLTLKDDAEHYRYNAWCCLKVAEALNLDLAIAADALKNFTIPEGRGKKHNLTLSPTCHITLIDDSYSGQPDAIKLAIKSLAALSVSGRRIAVIGKMAELGAYSRQAHAEIGHALKEAGIDVVIGVCEETKIILNELSAATEKHYFPNSAEATSFILNNFLKDGDAVLIKGAHYSSAVYKIAAALIAAAS